MVAKKLLVDDKIAACVKQMHLLGVICKVSNIKTSSGETFHFLKKRFTINFQIMCFEYFIVLLRAADWLTSNFLGMYCYFPVIRFGYFV